MLYRIEVYATSPQPLVIGQWSWTNKRKAIKHARSWVEWLNRTVIVRQQLGRKAVYIRPPVR